MKNNALPLIAILRGVTPENILAVAEVLVEEGFSSIEVPLNSPDALTSISMLVNAYSSKYLIGAGTVTTPKLAEAVIATGANLVVTPNLNKEVVSMSVAANCQCFPGVVTPTEAFAALEYGASGIKIFPASVLGIEGFKALKSVLPTDVKCYPVGGIEPSNESMHCWLEAGAYGFGLGSALFKSEMSLQDIRKRARAYVQVYQSFTHS
ncbi:2-dehydro-3-deoxy-6-phosphogalactonate aldolase [Glaciecola sp. 2405UD65-10]|uniref:2-dehydro-3-deoxy-6-phosphogalactonate aldolase n=1 Tax=Glaciecola sp. 2405UD65-10 TaxID=3397244 RepID=UPI003B5BB487